MIKVFTATWCQPCKILKAWLGNVGLLESVQLIDVDDVAYAEEVKKYGIRSVPTSIKLNQDGEVIGTRSGTSRDIEFFTE